MSRILTCVLCGRRGTHDFVMVVADPENPEAGHRARCRNRPACQRRIDQAHADEAPTGPAAGDRSGFATAESVAGLAREVEGLRRSLQPLQGLIGQVDDLARVVRELAVQVRARVRRTEPAAATSWLDLPREVEAAHEVLAELVEWLGEVYLRYADAAKSLPDCWLWHPDVVEELLWLQQSWQAAYRAEDATVAQAGDWHDRYRPGVVRRIKTLAGTCSLENHLPRSDRPGGARPVVPLGEALESIAAWWATGRADAPPEPTDEQLNSSAGTGRWGGGRR